MKIKISFIIIVLLISFSLQSKNKASNSELDKSVSAPASIKRADVIRFAKKLLGTPYRFASSNPKKGFDCSGFVNYVYKNFNEYRIVYLKILSLINTKSYSDEPTEFYKSIPR